MKSRLFLTTTVLVAASLAALPASSQPVGVSAPFLTGVWKEDAQCRGPEAMVFFPNSTMSSAGSTAVNYTVVGGNQIVLYGPGGQQSFGVQYVNPNKVVFTLNNDATIAYRCSQQAGNNAVGRGRRAPNNPTTFVPTPVTFAGGWGENGDCAKADIFTAGGHFQAGNGAGGTWSLFGNTLRMTMQNGAVVDAQIQNFTNKAMSLTVGGQALSYQRCF